jgi:hypothetical protein
MIALDVDDQRGRVILKVAEAAVDNDGPHRIGPVAPVDQRGVVPGRRRDRARVGVVEGGDGDLAGRHPGERRRGGDRLEGGPRERRAGDHGELGVGVDLVAPGQGHDHAVDPGVKVCVGPLGVDDGVEPGRPLRSADDLGHAGRDGGGIQDDVGRCPVPPVDRHLVDVIRRRAEADVGDDEGGDADLAGRLAGDGRDRRLLQGCRAGDRRAGRRRGRDEVGRLRAPGDPHDHRVIPRLVVGVGPGDLAEDLADGAARLARGGDRDDAGGDRPVAPVDLREILRGGRRRAAGLVGERAHLDQARGPVHRRLDRLREHRQGGARRHQGTPLQAIHARPEGHP